MKACTKGAIKNESINIVYLETLSPVNACSFLPVKFRFLNRIVSRVNDLEITSFSKKCKHTTGTLSDCSINNIPATSS